MGIFHGACFVFLEPIFSLMGASPDYMAEALDYGAPALLSVYFTSLALILQAVQLGYGDTASIMKTNIAGNGINGALSFVLISGMGPIPAFGVRGAAIGTIVGTLFTLLASFCLLKSKGFFRSGSFLPDRAYFHEVLPISEASWESRGANASAWSSSPAWRRGWEPCPLRCTASA